MRIAIIGLGSIGTRHASNLAGLNEHDLIGYDANEPFSPIAYKQLPIIKTCRSIEAVWDSKPDAALICTPPSTHHDLVTQALDHGCHVFCEKPLATSALLANDLVWRNDDKRVLVVGYQLRWQLKEAAEGCGQHLTFLCAQDMGQWPSQYKKDVLEEFSHEIDAAVFMNGPVESAVGFLSSTGAWRLELRHLIRTSTITIVPNSAVKARHALSNGGEMLWVFNEEKNNQAYKDEISAFLTACRTNAWTDYLCSGVEAAHVCRIIEACRESARECRVVRL